MKIGVITARFSVSGVPLAQVRLARALVTAGHQVDLVMGYVPADAELPPVPGANIVVFGHSKVRGLLADLWRYLRNTRPDVVFAAEDHLTAMVLLAAVLSRSPVIISGSSRVTPFDAYSNKRLSKPWLLKQMMRAVMWRADALTCVSEDMVAQYREIFASPPHVSVYNIVDDPTSRERARESVTDEWLDHKTLPVIIGAGTLAPWKGFEDLIIATAILKDRGRATRLMILGEGPERERLERLIIDRGVQELVRLPGRTENPLKYFAHADVFALSSRVEGMPNVLVEAMMCGATPVAADCPTGPRELLRQGKYGYLVPPSDPVAMADGIERALDSPIAAEVLAEAVRPFEQSAVIDRHFSLLGLA